MKTKLKALAAGAAAAVVLPLSAVASAAPALSCSSWEAVPSTSVQLQECFAVSYVKQYKYYENLVHLNLKNTGGTALVTDSYTARTSANNKTYKTADSFSGNRYNQGTSKTGYVRYSSDGSKAAGKHGYLRITWSVSVSQSGKKGAHTIVRTLHH